MAFEAALIVFMLSIYAVNKSTPLFDAILPLDIAKNHLNDFCAGVMFPAYDNVLCIVSRSRWRVEGFGSTIALGALCCFAWEVIAPLIVPWSVGDPIDCLCYLGGGLLYAALRRLIQRKAASDA